MAPAEINLGQTRQWLAQLHNTNLPSASGPSSSSSSSSGGGGSSSSSSSSSTHSRGSADYTCSASSCPPVWSSAGGGGGGGGTCTPSSTTTTTTMTTMTASSSPLTERRARSLQRLCALSDAHRAAEVEAAPSGNERFAPNNINYIKAMGGGGGGGGQGQGPRDAQSMGQSRWSRRRSVQSLEAVERDGTPRFSLSKLKSWW